jgi:glutathione S-transferase
MLLKETRIPYSFKLVDALKGQHRTDPEFKAAFPGVGLLPGLDDGGFKLAEAAAILSYLCEKEESTKFYPSDPQARARVHQWLHWHHQNTRLSTKGILTTAIMPKQPDAETIKSRGVKQYTVALKHMDQHLTHSKYLAGTEGVSIADLLIITEVDQLYPEAFGLYDYSPFKHVQRWVEETRGALPSYAEVFEPVKVIAKTFKK